jgi:hypothetical protein
MSTRVETSRPQITRGAMREPALTTRSGAWWIVPLRPDLISLYPPVRAGCHVARPYRTTRRPPFSIAGSGSSAVSGAGASFPNRVQFGRERRANISR